MTASRTGARRWRGGFVKPHAHEGRTGIEGDLVVETIRETGDFCGIEALVSGAVMARGAMSSGV
jgi:hypothetical protein